MKIYYATVNTGSPATGFISTGEVLTEEQAAALGEEKLAELVNAGVLAIGGETADEPAATGTDGADGTDGGEDTGTGGTGGSEDAATGETADDPAATEDGEDDLPELDLAEELVGEAEPEPEPATKRGRGKGGKSK